jgi:hypothetical protein
MSFRKSFSAASLTPAAANKSLGAASLTPGAVDLPVQRANKAGLHCQPIHLRSASVRPKSVCQKGELDRALADADQSIRIRRTPVWSDRGCSGGRSGATCAKKPRHRQNNSAETATLALLAVSGGRRAWLTTQLGLHDQDHCLRMLLHLLARKRTRPRRLRELASRAAAILDRHLLETAAGPSSGGTGLGCLRFDVAIGSPGCRFER